MITSIIRILLGLLLFKAAGGLGAIFAIVLKITGVFMIISVVCTLIESV